MLEKVLFTEQVQPSLNKSSNFIFEFNAEHLTVPRKVPSATNLGRSQSILRNVLEVCRSFTQITVDSVRVGNRQRRIALEFCFDVPKSHGMWKDSVINIEKILLPELEG
jgi:hypothetical protein